MGSRWRNSRRRWGGRGNRHGNCNTRRNRCCAAALYAQFDITAFQLKFGNVLLDEKIYEFFDFFLGHESAMTSDNFSAESQSVIKSFVAGQRTSHPRSVTIPISSIRTPPS